MPEEHSSPGPRSSKRSSTVASSKATASLQEQNRDLEDTNPDGGGVRRSGRKKTAAVVVNIGHAAKKPRSSAAPAAQRPATKPRRASRKRRARTSYRAGLEKFPHQLCTFDYPGFTINDDGGVSSSTVFGESSTAPKLPGGGLPWLRPRHANSVWTQMAVHVDKELLRQEKLQHALREGSVEGDTRGETNVATSASDQANATAKQPAAAKVERAEATQPPLPVAGSIGEEPIAESCLGVPAFVPPAMVAAGFVLPIPMSMPFRPFCFAETLQAMGKSTLPATLLGLGSVPICGLPFSAPLVPQIVRKPSVSFDLTK